jgi:hypothetical protein
VSIITVTGTGRFETLTCISGTEDCNLQAAADRHKKLKTEDCNLQALMREALTTGKKTEDCIIAKNGEY